MTASAEAIKTTVGGHFRISARIAMGAKIRRKLRYFKVRSSLAVSRAQ
jgi:hypothetical protein